MHLDWSSNDLQPDADQFRSLHESNLTAIDRQITADSALGEHRRRLRGPLLRAAGADERWMQAAVRDELELSERAFRDAATRLSQPAVDIDRLHDQDDAAMDFVSERLTSSAPLQWQGVLASAVGGGGWRGWNGESEEEPAWQVDRSSRRINLRAQARGEGNYDHDFSQVSSFLDFRLTPPSWGHLFIQFRPWAHGYRMLYSNDDWWNDEAAFTFVDTWVQGHQNFWRPADYQSRLSQGGAESHPETSLRIDRQYDHQYWMWVGESDAVTIRVGMRLHCSAKASGARSTLDFWTGNANYVYVPALYWRLTQ